MGGRSGTWNSWGAATLIHHSQELEGQTQFHLGRKETAPGPMEDLGLPGTRTQAHWAPAPEGERGRGEGGLLPELLKPLGLDVPLSGQLSMRVHWDGWDQIRNRDRMNNSVNSKSDILSQTFMGLLTVGI